jgi:GTP cyclohydrolase I
MNSKPTREEAEEAVRTLIAWAGDDPNREELLETPARVVESYGEFFSGYQQKIDKKISKVFDNTHGYDDMIILKNIILESYCEHHMVPIIGTASLAYIPDKKIIGLSKIARVIDIYSKRLQIQERLVIEIANSINQIVMPKGVGVVIESSHYCLSSRGAHKPGSLMRTSHLLGCFKEDKIRQDFFNSLK